MPHVRKSIRDAIVTAVTGLTTTGSRVFAGRVYPLEDTDLPGLLVFTEDEDIRSGSTGKSGVLERDLEVHVEAVFKDLGSLDDKGDTILAEVETALGPGTSLGGAKQARIARVEIERDGDGEKPAARMRMTFAVPYSTARGAPTTAL